MKILALDLSTKSTGWAIGEIDSDDITEYGCITSSSADSIKRIIIMRDSIINILKKYDDIERIVCEDVRTDFQNSRTQKVLTWLQSAIIIAVYEFTKNKINIEFIQANSWRSKIGIHTGRGIKRDTLKKQDIEYVKNNYNIEVNDDIADAIGILDSYRKPIKEISSFFIEQ